MLRITRIENDFPLNDFTRPEWNSARETLVGTYWDASPAPSGRSFSAKLLYSASGLYVLFSGAQSEPLVISDRPRLGEKSIGLWERDVFEIFLAPQPEVPDRYFEFEVSPMGEWLDVVLEFRDGERYSDWEFRSGMQAAARIEKGRVIAAVYLPFSAFGVVPEAGVVWRGNLFRCIGKGKNRGYLAWRPTATPAPDFHVPAAFGNLEFAGRE